MEENRPAWMRVRDSSTPFPMDKEILSQVCSQLQGQCSRWCWGKLELPNQLPCGVIQEKAESRVSKKVWLLSFLEKQMRRALLTQLLLFYTRLQNVVVLCTARLGLCTQIFIPLLPLCCHMDINPLGPAKGHLKQRGKWIAFAEQ